MPGPIDDTLKHLTEISTQDWPEEDVMSFKESTFFKESRLYQAILYKGKVREARKIVLLQGRSRFGEPAPPVVSALEAVTDLSLLEEVAVSLLRASDWLDLLARNGLKPREKEPVPLLAGRNPTLWHLILNCEESTTYQAIMREAAIYESQDLLLLQGRRRFGEPTRAELADMNLGGVDRMEELAVRLVQASSWQEVLRPKGPPRRGRRRRKTP